MNERVVMFFHVPSHTFPPPVMIPVNVMQKLSSSRRSFISLELLFPTVNEKILEFLWMKR